MLRKKLPVLLITVLLKGHCCLAQSQTAPVAPAPRASDYEQVSVPLPRAVTLLSDVARVLLSRNEGQDKVQALIDRRRARSEKRDQNFIISVPRNKLTRSLGLVD